MSAQQMALLGFFCLTPYAAVGIQTHDCRVAPTHNLLNDALLAELPRRGFVLSYRYQKLACDLVLLS